MKGKYDLDIHHRRSIRLKGYDYRRIGAYFITICTQRRCLFGKISDGNVKLNDVGIMVQATWNALPEYYSGVDIDSFVVMPDHIHGIILLTSGIVSPKDVVISPMSLSDVVHRFKSLATARYRHGVIQNRYQSLADRLWQRNYYERIIHNDEELNRIRKYISNNPVKWHRGGRPPCLP